MAPSLQLFMCTKQVSHLWRTAGKSTMQFSSPPTSPPRTLRSRKTWRRYIITHICIIFQPACWLPRKYILCPFMWPSCLYFLFVAPPEGESQIWERCIPLETPLVTYCHVRGFHLHQGGASQWCASLHESVSHTKPLEVKGRWAVRGLLTSAVSLLQMRHSGAGKLRGKDFSDRKSNTLWCFIAGTVLLFEGCNWKPFGGGKRSPS